MVAGLYITRVIDMAPVTALPSALSVPMRKWLLIANGGEETEDWMHAPLPCRVLVTMF